MIQRTTFFGLLSAFFLITPLVGSHPAWDEQLDFDEIEARLQTEALVNQHSMRSFLKKNGKIPTGTHPVILVILESGLKAVFKQEKACYGEVAAYKASKALGLRLVPPTVIRKINGIKGSLQFYVDSSIDLMRRDTRAFSKLDSKSMSDMHLFYFVIGQWDTHAGNQIIADNNGKHYLALIDNGGILRRQQAHYGGSAFLQKGTRGKRSEFDNETRSFPFHEAKTVNIKNRRAVKKLLGDYLTDEYIGKLSLLGSTATYILWKNTCWLKRGTTPPVKRYSSSTLNGLKNLNKQKLEEIWSDYRPINSERCDELIELILDRRDQVLKAAERGGKTVES